MEKISLRAARVNAGYTIDKVAELIGVGRNSVMDWENGKSFPRVNNMDDMCRLYGFEPNEIFLPAYSTHSRKMENDNE